MKTIVIRPVALSLLLIQVGCGNSPSSFARFYSGGIPSIRGIVPTQSRILVSVEKANDPQRLTQNIGALTYNGATLALANGSLLATTQNKTIALGGGVTGASSVFSALRPGPGYSLTVTLTNNGTAVGTGYAAGISLPAGQTTAVTVIIGANGQITVQSSAAGNAVGSSGSWTLASGDTVTLSTGFAASEASASTMQVALSSSLYGSAATISAVTGNFNQFVWNTGSAATTGGFAYAPSNLTTTGSQNGTITFQLLSASGLVVGQTTLSGVNVVAGSNLNLTMQ